MPNDYYDDDNYMEDMPRQHTLEDAFNVLPLKDDGIVPYEVVAGFSELEPDEVEQVRAVWQKMEDEHRVRIMERFAEITEVDYEMDYTEMARIGYDDPNPAVRAAAVNVSYAEDSLDNLRRLLPLAQKDESPIVRAAAISRLGQYIYLGEVEELDPEDTLPAQELALKLYHDPNESMDVRRRALEAISHCSLADVPQMINESYHHSDSRMRISAVTAMGNSCDPQWEKYVLEEMESDLPEMRFEAIRAAGALSLKPAIERLGDFGYDDDRQLQEAAVWALGEIGGQEAISKLEALADYAESENDDDLAEFIEEAIDMAYFMSDDDLEFEMMEFEDDDDDDGDYDEDDFEDDEEA